MKHLDVQRLQLLIILDIYPFRYNTENEEDVERRNDIELIKGKLVGLCFFITSTFGNGEPPSMASSMARWIDSLLNDQEDEVYDRLRAEEIIAENQSPTEENEQRYYYSN